MVRVVEISEYGTVDVLKVKSVDLPTIGAEEVLVRQTAIGINFDDILSRKGVYKNNKLPFILGNEACGVVEAIGKNVQNFKVGDRVAYVTAPNGAYAEARIINQDYLIGVPDYVMDDDVAATLLKGMTAHYLMRRTFFVREKNTILIHAAAGGVGQLMCMMAKQYGVKVIATVGNKEKEKVVQALGVDLVINYLEDDFVQKINEYTKGHGVDVVYDFVGRDTLEKSMSVVSSFGLLVSCGFTSGLPGSIDITKLYAKSSFITCTNFMLYKSDKMELILSANEIFAQLQRKLIRPSFYKKYKLEEVKEAHNNLEQRKQIGQSIIIV